jgi:hypothetical protein
VHIIGCIADTTGAIKFPDNWEALLVDSDDEELDDAYFCAGCTRSSESDFTRIQAHFWMQLPIYFGLPKWGSM